MQKQINVQQYQDDYNWYLRQRELQEIFNYHPNQSEHPLIDTTFNPPQPNIIEVPDEEAPASNNTFLNRLNSTVSNVGGSVKRSGTLGNNLGAISSQTPYLVINRPKLSLPEKYAHYHGFPCNITRRIGSLTGFTKVSDVHVDGINCSAMEQGFINQNLTRGIIIGTHRHDDPTVFTLYDNRSDIDTMFKDLTVIGTLSDVRMKEPTQLLNPNFILSGVNSDVIIQCNYIYSPQFKRYYVVKDKTSVHTDVWELHCEIDVLETFRNQIADLEAVIERQEFVYNLYLDDGTMKAYSDPYVQVKEYPVSFNDFGQQYIMVAIGQ